MSRPSDFNLEGDKDKPVAKPQSEAEIAAQRMFNLVHFDRNAAQSKNKPLETSEKPPVKPEPSTGDAPSFLSQKMPTNYYEGKLTPGAGSTAESGLKGLFNIDRLNTMLSSISESAGPYQATRVDGLSAKKDVLPTSMKAPDFVPKFPST
jgi:hypothetical protein